MKYYRGNIGLNLILLVVIGLSVALSLVPKFPKTPPKIVSNDCLDYDPPNKSESVEFNGSAYYLIKKDAAIASSKMVEMSKVGSFNGADLYIIRDLNYYGEEKLKENIIIYALRSVKDDYHIFDIYIKDGVPIPDSIRNSKNYGNGGSVVVVVDETNEYPPQGFNTSDIVNPTKSISKPAFLYGNNKVTTNYVNSLSGVEKIGSLKTARGNRSLYYHLDFIFLFDGNDAYEYLPSDTPVNFSKTKTTADQTLQVRPANIRTVPVNPICWYTPSCKPVIYLYPDKKTKVNVRVLPKGYFTYTNPDYSQPDGWNVTAYPDGTLDTGTAQYPYLYYETMLETQHIDVPTGGYVAAFADLPTLYDQILPPLGLNTKEMQDFKKYWDNILPKAPYYFVGIMNADNVNELEQLSISPKPIQVIRVRLYFEALTHPRSVESPKLTPVQRRTDGFTAVEWGGVVHTDDESTFTCSQ